MTKIIPFAHSAQMVPFDKPLVCHLQEFLYRRSTAWLILIILPCFLYLIFHSIPISLSVFIGYILTVVFATANAYDYTEVTEDSRSFKFDDMWHETYLRPGWYLKKVTRPLMGFRFTCTLTGDMKIETCILLS